MAAGDAAKTLDSKDICTACFVIDVLQALPGRGFVRVAGEFFTKLSTEFVHQGGERPDWLDGMGRGRKVDPFGGPHMGLRHNRLPPKAARVR